MSLKNNTKHRNFTIQGLRSFKDTLPKNIKRIINKKGHIYSETLNNWKYIVGNDLFAVCYPKSFKNSNGVDNLDLIAVNDAIRNHPIEAVGKRLRAAMTAMKTIKTDAEVEDSVLV